MTDKPLITGFSEMSSQPMRDWEPLQKLRLAAETAAIVAHAILLVVSAHKIHSHSDILLLFIMSAITLGFHLFYVTGVYYWKVKPLFNNMFAYGGNSRNTLKWLEYGFFPHFFSTPPLFFLPQSLDPAGTR